MPSRFEAATLAALILLPSGCGPGVQFIYEGNVRFEHCVRLDYSEQIVPTHRAACWREWMGRHSHGQTGDRVDYARRRLKALQSGDTAVLGLAPEQAEDSADVRPAATPVPTSAHVPPPPVARPSASVAGAQGPVPEPSASASPESPNASGSPAR